MLLVQFRSMNVFYSMLLLEHIIFHKSSSLLCGFLNRHVVAFFEASALKEVRILYVISATTVMLI